MAAGRADEEQHTTSDSASAPGSPKNKVKFLCSYGGKILPRPADNHLKYVGGETRVISVPRDISFPELMKKLTSTFDEDMILKYQLVPEDLDALISVKSDEDLRHMLDEYDRYGSTGTVRLRAFLFPASPGVIQNQMSSMEPHALEQRYIDAINGFVHTTASSLKQTCNNANHGSYSISSACSSPKSPDSCAETMQLNNNHQNGRNHMHRVHSVPGSMSSLNSGQCYSNHHVNQHHHYQNYRQPHHHGYQSSRLSPDLHKGGTPERLFKVRSVGRAESARYQVDHLQPQYYYTTYRHNGGSNECCNKCMLFDDGACSSDRRLDRGECLSPRSSLPRSAHHGWVGAKAWDSAIAGDS